MNNKLLNKKWEKISSIYKENVDDLYRFVYSKTYNKHLTEDVVSDTFYTLLDVIDSYDESKSKVRTFLFGIALNKLRQKWSSKKYRHVPIDEDILEHTPSISKKRDSSLVKKVYGALNALPEKYRQVITLRFTMYKSIKDTAKELGTTVTNVTTIQNRALKKLREKINE
ncbi:MAG TPA: sigma-70 family RNA polymerase sigma factor [Candidatus Dojkabacteria bacterium]|nr:sigma-70 family RNA polymerase sigma factor [Candidatus Dojkabacteria bacterium]